ncbi:hypothetical protein K491DRAFT_622918, partial [Lophiostoma macrostomum CBS 122681]
MAEALGVAAGVAGIISLTIQITQVAIQFGQDFKNEPEDVKAFISELGALKTVLSETHTNILLNPDFAEAFQGRRSVLLSQLLPQPGAAIKTDTEVMVDTCKTELEALVIDFTKRAKRHGLTWERFKGALLANKTRMAVEVLHRQCEALNRMMSVDALMLGATTIKEVKEARAEQQQHHQDQLNTTTTDAERREQHRDILSWLHPHDYAPQQSDYFEKRQSGTGKWLLHSGEFIHWRDHSNETLYCPGIPGAGKTIMTSIVIDHLHTRFKDDSSVGIAYIYCNFNQNDKQKPQHLLLSLLWQFLQHKSSELDMKNYEMYKRYRTWPRTDEILQALCSIVTKHRRCYIIIDALDECQIAEGDRTNFLEQIFQMQKETGVNVFATSRFIPEIEKQFCGSVSVQISANETDVQVYLAGRVSQLPAFVHSNVVLQEEIKEAIVGANEDSQELALQALSWITCAKRQLKIAELQHALAVELGTSDFDKENIPEIEQIASVCAGLLTVDKESNIVRLVHYTTQEYFERTWESWFPDAQAKIAETCLTYLSFDVFEVGPCEDSYESSCESYSLYSYSANNWGNHACSTPSTESLNDLLYEFLLSDDPVPSSCTFWNIIASNRRELVVQQLINTKRVDLNSRDEDSRTTLFMAARTGQERVVQRLLDTRQVHLNSRDVDGRSPLSIAARMGHKKVVQRLLD